METLTCRQCHAELVPQTSFCRQCGAAIGPTGEVVADELPTRRLDQRDSTKTQRLDPRSTGQGHLAQSASATADTSVVQGKKRSKTILITVVLVAVVAAVFSAAMITRKHNRVASPEGLVYPGSTELVNMVAEGGGRALQLETSDSLQTVEAWYRKSMRPGKVIQLTSNSVVLKNEKTTVTIASEDKKTNILVKIVP